MKKTLFLLALIAFITIEIFGQAIPKEINYQGVLKDASGNIVADNDYAMTFKIYNEPTAGTALWTEIQPVAIKDGLFSVQLGSLTPITTVPFDRIHFLGITMGTGTELTPRTMLTPSPYSFTSMNVLDNTISTDKLQNGAVTSSKIGSNQIVKSVNTLKDSVTLVAGSNISIVPSGNNLTINAVGVGSGTIGGSGTANYIPLFTGTTTLGNSAIYQTEEENIGIGTTTPAAKLDLTGSDALINGITVGRGTGSVSTNSAFGYRALYSNTTGLYNTANGYRALDSNTTGNYNTANGNTALCSNTEGFYNTANGNMALYYNNTGHGNTANGTHALFYNTTEHSNTAVGYIAGGDYKSSYSTFLGSGANPTAPGYTNVMGLGFQARPTASNEVRIGNSSVTSIGGYAAWSNLSDGRYKTSIQENVKGLDFIMKLRPVTFNLDVNKLASDLQENKRRDENGNIVFESSETDIKSRNEKSQILYTGFVAQEVEKAAKDLGYDFSGVDAPKNENDFYGLRYAEFVVPLVKAVQEQQKIIDDLTRRIEELEKR
ncbi:MAG: tail fiber domain-containing protein [Ignavibacteriaceae bacterium]|nr:tail fiber domain-containing protein [Ignavibacteriaceae bacterium]